jgi:FlaA1/EpsC-like NDP-sugar epimerase
MAPMKKITKNIRKRLGITSLIFFFLDALAIAFSFFVALYIKNDMNVGFSLLHQFIYELPIIILIYWVVFELYQMYKSLWEFASVEELIRGVIANITAVLASYIIVQLVYQNHLSLSSYVIALFIATASTLFIRLFYRLMKMLGSYFEYEETKKRALIIGAGNAGELVLREIQNNKAIDSKIIGFIDDDPKKDGRMIHGVTVLGNTKNIEDMVNEQGINMVYIAIPRVSKKRLTDLLNTIEKTGAQIKLFPPFYEMLQERSDKVELRDVKIEDLLGRDEIHLDESGIRDYLDEKTVVVTGGGGSIGSELVRQIRHYNPKRIIIIDIYENSAYDLQMELDRLYRTNKVHHKPEIIVLIASVRDKDRLDEIFDMYQVDVVFHAAAHKHVPLMEDSPREALKNNVLGTYNVAMTANEHSVTKFVLISTDKAVNPTNIMGASKRIAEKLIMAINDTSQTDFSAVRFGNVLGSNGSVIPLFTKQIQEGGPVTVTHPEINRFFMTIPEACQLVIQAGAYAKGGELFILDMGEPMRILDLAEKLIRLSGLEPYKDIQIQFTGLRPGEKMYEELLVDLNNSKKTQNEKIYI